MTNLIHASDAREELESQSMLEIERATAKTWGGRAAAAYQLAREHEGTARLRWIADAENYRQEAIEHAAMAEDFEFFRQIIEDLKEARRGLSLTGSEQ